MAGGPLVPRGRKEADAQELFDYLTRTDLADVAFTAWSVLAASLPLVGGGAGASVEHLRRAHDTRIQEAVVFLAVGFRDLAARLDRDYMRTDEFHGRFTRVIEEMTQARNESKRAEFVGAGLNLGLEGKHRAEFDLFVSTLSRLEPIHLALLGGLARRPPQAPRQGNYPLVSAIQELTPNVDDAIRLRLYEDLTAAGLVEGPSSIRLEQDDTFHDESEGLLTGFGQRFVAFVTDPR